MPLLLESGGLPLLNGGGGGEVCLYRAVAFYLVRAGGMCLGMLLDGQQAVGSLMLAVGSIMEFDEGPNQGCCCHSSSSFCPSVLLSVCLSLFLSFS